ncbi:MAG: carboxymuconolactone decarboxylase family protein [Proteobacteria bacterium]|nr:carboxymuconolactone decarboxylase family protein [Pseudomonadota bacterium]
MSRINTPAAEAATGATAELFGQIKKAAGRVPNAYAAIGALEPNVLKAMLQADGALSAGTLSKQDRETIKIVVSQTGGCDYCVAAHSQIGKMVGLQPETLRQIRTGEPTGETKRDALIHFVRKLVRTSGTIAEAEFDAIRAAGYTESQLVEISLAIAVIVFTNVFNRINDTTIDFPAVA